MKNASSSMNLHIAGRLTTLTRCIRIDRVDGTSMYFTSLDQPLTFDGHEYKPGYDPTAIASTDEMNVDNLEFAGVLDHEDITSEDIRAGRYDHAAFEIFAVNYEDVAAGKIILKTGWLGNVTIGYPDHFTSEGRSLMQAVQVKYGKIYTPRCKWDLGEVQHDRLGGTVGCQATLTPEVWEAETAYLVGDIVITSGGITLRAVTGGTSGTEEPDTAPGGSESTTWSIRNDIGSEEVTFEIVGGAPRYTLTIETRGPQYQCGEVDLWLMGVAPLPDVVVPQPGLVAIPSQPYTLASMTSLTFSFDEALVEAAHDSRCGPGLDVGASLATVYFRNTVNGHTFQYEVYTSDSRGFRPLALWYANAPSGAFVGVADNLIDHYGESYLSAGGGTVSRSIDILARVTALFASVPNTNVDQDLAHWKIVLVTVGPFTNGAGRITYQVSNMDLVADGGSGPTSVFTDPGLTDHGAYVVRPVELGPYILQGPVGDATARWAFLTDGVGAQHQLPTSTELDETWTGITDGTVQWEVIPTVGQYSVQGTVASITQQFRKFVATGDFVTETTIPVDPWKPKHRYWAGDSVLPSTPTEPVALRAVALTDGKSGGSEPTWPTDEGATVKEQQSGDDDDDKPPLVWRMVMDRWYQGGVLTWLTGDNAGLPKPSQVFTYDPAALSFELLDALPYPIQVGDTFTIDAGCDKTLPTCWAKFRNVVNFGGEPFIQGLDTALDYPVEEE